MEDFGKGCQKGNIVFNKLAQTLPHGIPTPSVIDATETLHRGCVDF